MMERYFQLFLVCIIASSCEIISNQEKCAEFRLKNGLSSTIIVQTVQIIDSTFTFYTDSFTLAPGETQLLHKDCSLSNVDPYPTGDYAKFTFSNNKIKIDTFRNRNYIDLIDSISLYNKTRWITDNSNNRLKTATYIITAKDSLEAN